MQVRFNLGLPQELRKKLREYQIANAREYRSENKVIIAALEAFLNQNEKENVK